MSLEPHIFFDEVNERQGVFHRRSFLLGGFAGVGLLALTGRLTALQLVEAERYRSLSASNQFNFRLRPPPRGRVLDRNGVEIASNRPDFRLMMVKSEAKDIDGALDKVAEVSPITPDRRRQLKRELTAAPRFVPVALKDGMGWDEFARVNVRTPELPGVTAEMGEARVYPFGGAFAHVIGYVSRVSADDIQAIEDKGGQPDSLMLHPGFRIGKQGIEKSLDEKLRGKPGFQKVEVDSVGRIIREDPAGDIRATAGAEVVLTLDADIQTRALEVMGEESAGVVVMDIRNGDILCLASTPSFDANQFVTGVPAALYKELASFERKPLLDKALSGLYPPGSTFKTMTALAALEMGHDPNIRMPCNGVWSFGRAFHCWKHDGHGMLDMHGAMRESCDCYFYPLGLKVGPDRMAAMARRFGLEQVYDIGIPGQKKGLVPDAAWKRKRFPRDPVWHPGESPSMGIGQGYLQVNALQLAVMVSRIANGQKAITPRLIKAIAGQEMPAPGDHPDLGIAPEHLAIIRAGMDAVANDPAGTTGAYRRCRLGLGDLTLSGKTGSAQVRSYDKAASRKNEGIPWQLKDHGLFICFAPSDAPRYAMAVIIQHGEGGAKNAAPRATELMKTVLLKDPEMVARIENQLPSRDQTSAIPKENEPDMPEPDISTPPPDPPLPGQPT
jgi:penicillin-binding protein 2